MLPRSLEPEVMDSPDEAIDYDAMDHSEVNRIFVDDFLTAVLSGPLADRLEDAGDPLEILDVGTGTAQIPIELCRRDVTCRVTAVDLAAEMIKLAERNVGNAGLTDRIRLQRLDAKQLPDPDNRFDAVISNSIVHHIPRPASVLGEMFRVLCPGGLLFVRDLLRPNDLPAVDHLVSTYAGDANPHQQRMFRESLHAALAVDEIRALIGQLGHAPESVRHTTDRHWTLAVTTQPV